MTEGPHQQHLRSTTHGQAYRSVIRDHPRCAANDIPPWESFSDYDADEPGVATCDQCNCPQSAGAGTD